MPLTTAQQTALRNDIQADPALSVLTPSADNAFAIADAYNLTANPAWIVWRSSVTAEEIMQNGFVWTAVDGLTAGKARIWDWMTRYGSINPSKANVRQGMIDCFGAGSAMATAISPHLKRSASRLEKLLSTGTGTTASPANMGYEGTITYLDVMQAMGW